MADKGLRNTKSVGKMGKNLLLADVKPIDPKGGTTLPAVTKGSDDLGKRTTDLKKAKSTKSMTADIKKEGPSGIPRNVNDYRHIIDSVYANESDVEWVLKLRGGLDPETQEKLKKIPNETFKFAGSKLECQKEKHNLTDLKTPLGSLMGTTHLFKGRIGPTPSLGTVLFETGLRNTTNDKLVQLEKGWRSVPFKDRKRICCLQSFAIFTKEYPQLYPSFKEMHTIKTWSTKNLNIKTHSGFVGHTDYLNYPEAENFRSKNVVEAYHLHKNPEETLSNLRWELSMRYPKPEDLRKTISRKSPDWKRESKQTKADPKAKNTSPEPAKKK